MADQQRFYKGLRNIFFILIISLVIFHPIHSPAEHRLFGAASGNIWPMIAKKFKLESHVNHPRVQAQINYYKKHPEALNEITEQAAPYLHFILQEIEKRQLPHELLLLPIMESAYDPTANSHAGAAGLWQFMPRTATSFGMQRNWWYDGRHDLHASTHGALEYMRYLVKFFDGDWLLAAAAYDSGEGTVQRAIKKNENAGKKGDYWSLKLPKETQIYVPRFLALAAIFSNPAKYGIELNPVANKPVLSTVDVGRQMDLPKIAELANVDLDTLTEHNPAFKRLVMAPQGPYKVMLPVDKVPHFQNQLAKLSQDDHKTWFQYRVKAKDDIKILAARHQTSPSIIQTVNKLTANTRLKPGHVLALPLANAISTKASAFVPTTAVTIAAKVANVVTTARTYTVRRGDSLYLIAKRFRTSVKSIKSLNGLRSNALDINQELTLPLKVKR